MFQLRRDLHDPNPVLQVTEHELQSAAEEKRTDFLRGHVFPDHQRSDTQPKVEQPGS